jgi:hypothetical protein
VEETSKHGSNTCTGDFLVLRCFQYASKFENYFDRACGVKSGSRIPGGARSRASTLGTHCYQLENLEKISLLKYK